MRHSPAARAGLEPRARPLRCAPSGAWAAGPSHGTCAAPPGGPGRPLVAPACPAETPQRAPARDLRAARGLREPVGSWRRRVRHAPWPEARVPRLGAQPIGVLPDLLARGDRPVQHGPHQGRQPARRLEHVQTPRRRSAALQRSLGPVGRARARDGSGPWLASSQGALSLAVGSPPVARAVWRGFPSEAEAGVYLWGSGKELLLPPPWPAPAEA